MESDGTHECGVRAALDSPQVAGRNDNREPPTAMPSTQRWRMTKSDNDRFRVRPRPPRSRDGVGARRFVSEVVGRLVEAGGRAGVKGRPTSNFGRGHVASRMATTPNPRMRRVIIKSRIVRLRSSAHGSVAAHLRYIQRDGVTRSGARGEAYGATEEHADPAAFEARGRGDRHQFRFIVSVEDAELLQDLRPFTRAVMETVSTDLETPLDWIAVDHWDTDNPHTHVVLRGATKDGRDLVVAPHYMSSGMRTRATAIATEWLGPRTELEIHRSRTNEMRQERFTGLDRALIQRAHGAVVDLQGPANAASDTELRGRLQQLEIMGLAAREAPHRWRLAPTLKTVLTQLGERGDILRAIGKAVDPQMRDYVIHEPGRLTSAIGRIAGKGLVDELSDRAYLVIEGIDGRGHYLPLGKDASLDQFPIGGIAEVRHSVNPKSSDFNIVRVARNGIYRVADHVQSLPSPSRAHADSLEVVATHVRRLEALRRSGIVTRIDEGVWRVPDDLLAQGQRFDARKASVELVTHLPVERQVGAMVPTWLDGHLEIDPRQIAMSGFGRVLRTATSQRAAFLVEQRLADRVGGHVVVHRERMEALRRREIDATGAALASETGLFYRTAPEGVAVHGSCRRSVVTLSGRFAMLDDGLGFTLVPWRPVIEARLGQAMSAIVRGGTASWSFGRTRGPAIDR